MTPNSFKAAVSLTDNGIIRLVAELAKLESLTVCDIRKCTEAEARRDWIAAGTVLAPDTVIHPTRGMAYPVYNSPRAGAREYNCVPFPPDRARVIDALCASSVPTGHFRPARINWTPMDIVKFEQLATSTFWCSDNSDVFAERVEMRLADRQKQVTTNTEGLRCVKVEQSDVELTFVSGNGPHLAFAWASYILIMDEVAGPGIGT